MQSPDGVEVRGPVKERFEEVLTPAALNFLAALQRRFGVRRDELLSARRQWQADIDAGAPLDFLPQTVQVREDPSWRVAEPAPGLVDRRVEITGPTDRKMTINALNSGAKVWLADFEDANTPLWENLVGGQLNLIDALERRVDFREPASGSGKSGTEPGGKAYALRPDEELATIVVRPRGWHLDEKHVLVDGARMSGSLFDFGLYFFHCARRQLDRGHGPYFYLPKLQHYLEARLWNEVFAFAQEQLGIPRGTIRATVLIETIPAAFQMEEILYELREHSAGLNAGRWDYLFSIIKTFRTRGRDFVLPERNAVTMTAPMMRAYTELLVRTCHRRGAHAIGGMAAFIPSRRDPEVNAVALEKVRADKLRESGDGFDGSWVAHPDLVPVCREVFDDVLGARPNQLARQREDVAVTAADLLDVASTPGEITEEGLRSNVSVGLQYLAAWLRGTGAVAIFNLMEDAATAEISRSQVWQWIHNEVPLAGGQTIDAELVNQIIDEELAGIREAAGDSFDRAGYQQAVRLFRQVALAKDFEEFLTLPAYEQMP
jgi:malate synthase